MYYTHWHTELLGFFWFQLPFTGVFVCHLLFCGRENWLLGGELPCATSCIFVHFLGLGLLELVIGAKHFTGANDLHQQSVPFDWVLTLV